MTNVIVVVVVLVVVIVTTVMMIIVIVLCCVSKSKGGANKHTLPSTPTAITNKQKLSTPRYLEDGVAIT